MIIISIIFCFLSLQPASAQTAITDNIDLPAVKVAMSDDHSIIIERVLYTALKRSGYQMAANISGMRTALADVNYGDAAILATQTAGWSKVYPNLIQVPVAIDNVEYTAYTRSDDKYKFSKWEDLAGLRLAYRWQNEYIANNIWRADASKLVTVNDYTELWASLINGSVDVVILPRMSHFKHRFPKGIKAAGAVEIQPVYTYVNDRHAYLASLLEKAYLGMFADGTMTLIHKNREFIGEHQTIFHINSFNAQNEWERRQMDSIRKDIRADKEFEYYSFNLNSNESHSQTLFNTIVSDMIRAESVERHADLIIVSGNEAFEFALNNYYLLFPNVPVLFFGVQGMDDSMIYGLEEKVTGIFETLSFSETASEMLRLFPETRKIFVLNSQYLSRSTRLRENIQEYIDSGKINLRGVSVELVFSENKPLAEILNDIRNFKDDTMVLIGNYFSDINNTFYSKTEVQKLVAQASRNPVFCLTTSFIGEGTFGGLVSSTNLQTEIVASMASDLLNGKPLAEIPVIYDSAFLNQWQFDYETSRRFNVNVKTLPRGHIIINRILPIWETNPLEFRLMLTVAVLLFLIICGLVMFLKILAKKQEEALVASEAKSMFLANMSHEIRTPMNAILGITEILIQNESLPAEIEEGLSNIYSSCDLLMGIINDILDFSKIEAGKLDIKPSVCKVESLINESAHLNMMRIDNKPIDFELQIDENVPEKLFGDEVRIKQIFNNLLSNAFKYTDAGKVTLSVDFIPPAVKQSSALNLPDGSQGILVISVRDTGCGMTKEQINKMYDEYSRFNFGKNVSIEGTGLGLAITNRLVSLMGGSISVESELRKGTLFTVRLPQGIVDDNVLGKNVVDNMRHLRKNHMKKKRKEQITRDPMPYGKVMVVDDVETNIYVAAGLMKLYKLEIDTVMRGQDAIDKIKSGKVYDVIFMDHMMPEMDGIEAAKQIRALGYNAPIVALTANAVAGQADMFMRNGFDQFISKPIDIRQLNAVLNKFVRDKQPPEVIEAARRQIKNTGAETGGKKTQQKVDPALLESFVRDAGKTITLLEGLGLQNDEFDNQETLRKFIIIVHGIKSSLWNINETELAEFAYKLETDGRELSAGQHDDISRAHNVGLLKDASIDFIDRLRELLIMLEIKLKEESGNSNSGGEDNENLRNKLKMIQQMCADYDRKGALDIIAELKSGSNKTKTIMDKIMEHVLHSDFEKAGELAAVFEADLAAIAAAK